MEELESKDFDPNDDELGDDKKKSKKSKKPTRPSVDRGEEADTKKPEPKSLSETLGKLFDHKDESSDTDLKDDDESVEDEEIETENDVDTTEELLEPLEVVSEGSIENISLYTNDEEITVPLDEINIEHEIVLRPAYEASNEDVIENYESVDHSLPKLEYERVTETSTLTYDPRLAAHNNMVDQPLPGLEFNRVSVTDTVTYDSMPATHLESTGKSPRRTANREEQVIPKGWPSQERINHSTAVNPNMPTEFSSAIESIKHGETKQKKQLTNALRSERAYSRHHDKQLKGEINKQAEELKQLRHVQEESVAELRQAQPESRVTNRYTQTLEVNSRNLEVLQAESHAKAVIKVEQVEPSDQQAELPEDHHLEQSAWHRIEIDTKTGRVVEAPTIAYGKEFKREQGKEMWRQGKDNEPLIVASGQLATGSITDLGKQTAIAAPRSEPSSVPSNPKPSKAPLSNNPIPRIFSNATDAVLWAIFILVLFLIAAVSIL